MRLPRLDRPQRYTGLYVLDFGDHTAVGFTAEEVAQVLESERYKDTKVYKIHKAYPDGRLELKGVPAQTFQLEAGIFFYASSEQQARDDFRRLIDLAIAHQPPCKAKVHLARYRDDLFVTALIYPAEYDDEISDWLLRHDYRTAGAAEGGTGAVQRYYERRPVVLDRHQLYGEPAIEPRTGQELLASLHLAVQR
ncbi:MAG: hypothetical protein QHH07_10755 [Sedimentisphaerales bacterium]|jgi:hypothetical protein|nr:hypothetical protein [Sedimentisphaerales bacterium]